VGGRNYKPSDPKKDIRGPDLNRVPRRLRSDWVNLWLCNPKWFTPYTSMPQNFPHNAAPFLDLYSGDSGSQLRGTVDALLNYVRMMEEMGPIVFVPRKKEGADGSEPPVTGQVAPNARLQVSSKQEPVQSEGDR
jgi:hypothetical protein